MKIETAKILSTFLENRSSSISDFENWVYSNSSLEDELGSDIFAELISLNFNDGSIRVKVKELVDPIIDYADLHKNEILTVIEELISKSAEPLNGIKKLYVLVEKGYVFLGSIDVIGNFGEQWKSIVHPIDKEMDKESQWNKMLIIEPNLLHELTQLKEKIETNKIVLTGKKEVMKHYGEQFKYIEN
ncbi:MAG: hypothetical protein R2828_34925 [Saprospiraceae bacterium]